MAAISPQTTFQGDIFSAPLVHTDKNLLACVEPDYKPFIPANSLRRMTRVLKIGLTTALQCINGSGVETIGPIVTGTGKGSLQDTEKFIREIEQYKETALNPTPFIQSTYNSVNGLIALQVKGTAYNNTFVHRGFSFENALLDSMMLLAEGAPNTLTGAFEEITAEHFYIKSRIGFWKDAPTDNRALYETLTPGSIAGEGATFFLLTGTPAPNSKAALTGFKMLYKPAEAKLAAALAEMAAGADLVLTGRNGDSRYEHYYQQLDTLLPGIPQLPFKHLCGEHDTAGAFGMWLGAQILHAQQVPAQWFPMLKDIPATAGKILLYNHFYGEQHAIMVLERV
ncbi:beta-ketoacyl synthase chain length factor [Chitinophaga qingshengii]|uniref:Beta-ketoacyl synthase chain length factor n=1 Tax=Chitinophaga qingshengii TaxID=1569794 RepID=A0ABR7TJI9_9BACT|nr:beta-ketoacyl synthase chain length factor [Chitinophaga qingshengii]MBC9930661.1 beta-ketoacyl synthase chain length factor [Chitinophaga qingshengii]